MSVANPAAPWVLYTFNQPLFSCVIPCGFACLIASCDPPNIPPHPTPSIYMGALDGLVRLTPYHPLFPSHNPSPILPCPLPLVLFMVQPNRRPVRPPLPRHPDRLQWQLAASMSVGPLRCASRLFHGAVLADALFALPLSPPSPRSVLCRRFPPCVLSPFSETVKSTAA
jgi:hypothetical protein